MKKKEARARRKKTVRKKIFGTSDRPRVCVYKTLKNISVQLIDDVDGKTVCGLSTLSPRIKDKIAKATRKDISSGKLLGEEIAKEAAAKGITRVVFDRAGYRYHGVIKALANAARENGLQF